MRGFSPSTAERWVNCPGSVALSQSGVAAYSQTEEAKEGEAAHWVAEQVARRSLLPLVTPNGVDITDDMREGAAIYAALLPDDVMLEERRSCARIHPQMGQMRADAAFIVPETKTLTIVDYKFGFTHVDAFENLQLLASVAGFEYEAHENLELVVVQPRAFGQPPIKSWKLTVAEYNQRWLPLLQTAAREVVAPLPRTESGTHCMYCPVRHTCRTLADTTRSIVDYVGTASNLELTPEGAGIELALLLDAAERIKHRVAGVEAQVEGWIREGKRVPNFTLQQSYSNLRWTVPAEKVLTVAKLAGVNILAPQEPLTPTQAKKAGLADSVIEKIARRDYIGDKLKRTNSNQTRKMFQQ
jgi:hypothetical protein